MYFEILKFAFYHYKKNLVLLSFVAAIGFLNGYLLINVGNNLISNDEEISRIYYPIAILFSLKFFEQIVSNIFSQKLEKKLELDILKKFKKNYFTLKSKFSHSEILHKIEVDHENIIGVVSHSLPQLMIQTSLLFVYFFVIFMASKDSLKITFSATIFILVFALVFKTIKKNLYSKRRRLSSELYRMLKNYVYGFEFLILNSRVNSYMQKISRQLEFKKNNQIYLGLLNSSSSQMQWIFRYILVVAVTFPLIKLIQLNNDTVYWFYLLLMSMTQIYHAIIQKGVLETHWFHYKNGFEEKNQSLFNEHKTQCLNEIHIKNLEISFSNKTFFKNLGPFNYKWKKGDKIFISGKSGAGKTTFLRTLSGLHHMYTGEIILPQKANLSFVTQDPFFFDGESLRENLNFSETCKLKKNQYLKLKKILDLCDFFNSLPDGLDTIIGTEGIWPSRGQRVRLSLMRELLNESELLFLDEPTASLDNELVKKVLKYLDQISKEKIIVISDHSEQVLKHFRPNYKIHLDPVNKPQVFSRSKHFEMGA